jgi:hypothetical protein
MPTRHLIWKLSGTLDASGSPLWYTISSLVQLHEVTFPMASSFRKSQFIFFELKRVEGFPNGDPVASLRETTAHISIFI